MLYSVNQQTFRIPLQQACQAQSLPVPLTSVESEAFTVFGTDIESLSPSPAFNCHDQAFIRRPLTAESRFPSYAVRMGFMVDKMINLTSYWPASVSV